MPYTYNVTNSVHCAVQSYTPISGSQSLQAAVGSKRGWEGIHSAEVEVALERRVPRAFVRWSGSKMFWCAGQVTEATEA